MLLMTVTVAFSCFRLTVRSKRHRYKAIVRIFERAANSAPKLEITMIVYAGDFQLTIIVLQKDRSRFPQSNFFSLVSGMF